MVPRRDYAVGERVDGLKRKRAQVSSQSNHESLDVLVGNGQVIVFQRSDVFADRLSRIYDRV